MKRQQSQCCSISKKAEIIRDYERNSLSKSDVEKKYNIKRQTFNSWLMKRDEIINSMDQSTLSPLRKRMRVANNPDLEECLLKWFRHMRSQNIPLSGTLLAAKANDFASLLGIQDFQCNDGWLHRFKGRHDITHRLVSGEGQSVFLPTVEKWREALPSLLESYEPRNVYNADETALFWQLIPSKTLAEKGDVCRGGKLSKQ